MKPEERLAVVLEGQKESNTVKGVCEKYGISRDTYYRWKRELKEAAEQYWNDKNPGRKSKDDFSSKSEAEAAYQQQKQENEKKDKELFELKKQLEGTTLQRDFYRFRLSLYDAKKTRNRRKTMGLRCC